MIPKDKQGHFLVGAAISFAASFFIPPALGLGLSTLAGIGKEVWDWGTDKGTPDAWDAVATIAGGMVGALVGLLIS